MIGRRILLLAGVFALFAGATAAKEVKLSDLFDPLDPAFTLDPYQWEDWKELDKATKLRAKAIDPAAWSDPPPDPPDEKEGDGKEGEKKEGEGEEGKDGEKEKDPAKPQRPPRPNYPKDRFPGFRFDDRLKKKKGAFERLVEPASASKVEGVIKRLKSIEKVAARFEKELDTATEEYVDVKEQLDKQTEWQVKQYRKKHGKPPAQVLVNAQLLARYNKLSRRLQYLVAVQQSERQFHDWLIWRVSALIEELSEAERTKPLAMLAKGVRDKDWRFRVRCGDILGRLTDERAQATLKGALEAEKDPMVLAELIRIRARRAGKEILGLLEQRLADERWTVRSAVIRELARIRLKETVDLLVAQLAKEQGRLRDDVAAALKQITRQRYGPEPEPWRIWWEKVRAKWTPPALDAAEAGAPPDGKQGQFVYFYGIRTSSKRIVFCIDFSGSMSFPLDGQGGKKAPRIETARRELFQALAALPEDAQFNIVTYNATVAAWKKKMMPATLRNKQAARKFIEKQEPAGSTNIYDALSRSMDIAVAGSTKSKLPKGKDPEADTIFFLTDGIPTNGRVVDPHQILKEVTERNTLLKIVIHTVGVSKEQNAGFLLNLAENNHGQYVGHK